MQLDTTKLDGHRLVAFERLFEDNEQGRLVALHEDWNDEQQSVLITSSQNGSNTTRKSSQAQGTQQNAQHNAQQKSQKTAATGDVSFSPLIVLLAGIIVLVIAKMKLI